MSGARAWVVKIGGALCDEEAPRRLLAESCARLDRLLVVVHGGGRQVTELQRRFGIEPRFVEGRRVTAPEEMVPVEMALCGTINKSLVRDLLASGRRAVGLSGCDGGTVRCDLIDDLGRVGSPSAVEPALVEGLLASGWTPVVAPVSLGPSGEAVNVNADEVAGALAAAIGAERLLLLTDVPGVMIDGLTSDALQADRLATLIAGGEITGGMLPKLKAACRAASGGVREVVIGGFDGGPLAAVKGTRVYGTREVLHA